MSVLAIRCLQRKVFSDQHHEALAYFACSEVESTGDLLLEVSFSSTFPLLRS